jgi:homoserine trans-succinylase
VINKSKGINFFRVIAILFNPLYVIEVHIVIDISESHMSTRDKIIKFYNGFKKINQNQRRQCRHIAGAPLRHLLFTEE